MYYLSGLFSIAKFRTRSFLVSALLICFYSLSNASSLDLGSEYRLRGLSYSNLDYVESTGDSSNFYSHRLRIYLIGSPLDNFEIITRIQAVGIAAGTTPTSRYPDADFNPWIENIYFTLKDVFSLPLDLSVGKQPFKYGQGLIVSDDNLGFTGIKLKYSYPWKNLTSELFTAKISESQAKEGDYDIHGLVTILPGTVNTWQLGLFFEKDKSSGTIVGVNPASYSKKYFIDLLVEGKMEGAFYSGEVVLQKGNAELIDPDLVDPNYDSMAYLFEGGYFGYSDRLGRLEIKATYGEGDGDNAGTPDKIESFEPGLGHKFDGLERVGYGDFYAATLYDVFQGLNPGYSGLQIIGFGGSIAPWVKSNLYVNYLLYKAKEAPSGGAKNLGNELDFGGNYLYSSYLNFKASIALFFPGDATQIVGSRATRIMLETEVKF
ncbi:MAG: hypothetical protein ABII27_07565 [bacterium]